MKYPYERVTVPANKRAEYNRRVLALIGSGDLQGLTAADIFNLYSGLGGLHGLARVDFENFYEYTEAKKEIELGQFFTPPALCQQIITSLRPTEKMRICDMTCGSGNFFNYLPNEKFVYGCEIEQGAFNVARFLFPDANIVKDNFIYYEPAVTFDMVIGNPPFNLSTTKGVSQYVYIRKAAEFLRPGGLLCFIAPEKFLEDEYTNKRKWEEINQDFNYLCQCKLPANWFNVGINTKLLYFQKKGVTNSNTPYSNTYIPFEPDTIYQNIIRPIHEQNTRDSARIQLYTIQRAVDDHETQRLIVKYLYHLKTQKTLRDKYYLQALDKLHILKTQVKPPDMKEETWREQRLTPERVAKWMKKKIRSQYDKPPQKVLKLVKRQYDFKVKAYDPSLTSQQHTTPIYQLTHEGRTMEGYTRLLQRKNALYRLMIQPYSEMERNAKLDAFLHDFYLDDCTELNLFGSDERIILNAKQMHDCGLAFQKPYSILNWEQGGGKSIAGMAWLKWIEPKIKNAFIIAPALAVQLTWAPHLEKYGYKYLLVDSWQDLQDIPPRGTILLISFNMVHILERHLKRLVKRLGYKIGVLVDESDELSNIHSRRTGAALNCFRKAKYKILTTGTTTRNNINEIYPQLELLFNNSVYLLSWAETVFKPDKDDALKAHPNDYYGEPFPAYRGHTHFKYSFCPQKTTVFGVKRDTQDVYNVDALKDIIERTVLTRTFDDIVGKRIYKIRNHQVIQNGEERRLYALIMEDFYKIVFDYYSSTGSARRDANLRLIRQIKLLIQSSSTPHKFKHYESKELPHKFYTARDLVASWKNEKVAIGTVFKEAAREYFQHMQTWFPGRMAYYIDGEKSFAARKKILADFQRTDNGILISTQQSLKSSVDVETCNKCIVESLQWNIPKISQYYFRFIRFNSKEEKEIHFLTYADTIEQNILALLMSKQKLNEFIKTCELATREELYEDFDIDMGILNQIITKEYDEEGKLHLKWGEQKFLRTT